MERTPTYGPPKYEVQIEEAEYSSAGFKVGDINTVNIPCASFDDAQTLLDTLGDYLGVRAIAAGTLRING